MSEQRINDERLAHLAQLSTPDSIESFGVTGEEIRWAFRELNCARAALAACEAETVERVAKWLELGESRINICDCKSVVPHDELVRVARAATLWVASTLRSGAWKEDQR